jgi:hypothetical protein
MVLCLFCFLSSLALGSSVPELLQLHHWLFVMDTIVSFSSPLASYTLLFDLVSFAHGAVL